METGQCDTPVRSTFVNVVAWIFIVFCGFATLISILQNIMVHTVFKNFGIEQSIEQGTRPADIPFIARMLFNHFDLIIFTFLILSATCLFVAISLLKRKNWARIVFIGLMCLGIVYTLGGLVLQFIMLRSMDEFTGGAPPPPDVQNMFAIMKIAFVIIALGISALLGYIIKKLFSKEIKAEFQ